ncbi:putative acyltransferase [Klebsiella variicola]|uniref:Putative acyltransferase n=1 Tax=Klebsiella variicola TaxID=244366 RepID=A0A7H4MAE3_KLEVA|nr:putative acyltransferase [Klebsiella variicola]
MSRLLAAITLPLSIALTILVTIICSVPIIVAGLIKLLVPIPAVWRSISVFCNFMMYCWCEGLALLLHLNPWLKWDVEGLEGLNKKNWYLLISNHHSWADIVVLCVLFRKHIPMNKYFLKTTAGVGTLHRPRLLGVGYALYAPLFTQFPY